MVEFTKENAKGTSHAGRPGKKPSGGIEFTTENAGDRTKPREEPKSPPNFLEQMGDFGLDTMRNFNDTVSFGLYPKFLEWSGLDKNAVQDVEESNPWAGLIGDTLGYMVPGSMASKGVGTVVKSLERNTIPSIMTREGLANAAVAATDQVARTGELDPTALAIEAAMGGAMGGALSGVLAAAGRTISPGARVRGRGVNMSDAEKEAAKMFSEQSAAKGITLNNSEAMSAVAPSKAQDVQQLLKRTAEAPGGNAVLDSFNKARTPGIEQAGLDLVEQLGGGVQPTAVTAAATDAMNRNRSLVKESARPYYKEAEVLPSGVLRKVPPSWVPRGGYTDEAIKRIMEDPGMMKGLTLSTASPTNPKGIPPSSNSVLLLDAAKQELDATASGLFDRGRPQAGNYAKAESTALAEQMAKIAPTYPEAVDISKQGGRMVEGLETGPLGTLANTPTTTSQGRVLFGAPDEASRQAASIAARNLPPEIPAGVLANTVDQAVEADPLRWGQKVTPNPNSAALAEEAAQRAGVEDIASTLGSARAVDNNLGGPASNEHTSPKGSLWQWIRDLGADNTAKKLLDPNWIPKMGKMGPVQGVLTSGTVAATNTANQGRRKKRRPAK